MVSMSDARCREVPAGERWTERASNISLYACSGLPESGDRSCAREDWPLRSGYPEEAKLPRRLRQPTAYTAVGTAWGPYPGLSEFCYPRLILASLPLGTSSRGNTTVHQVVPG